MLNVQRVPGDLGYLLLLSPGLVSFSGAFFIHNDKMLQEPHTYIFLSPTSFWEGL